MWAYGCTLIEFATGNPPNSGLRERMQIGRQLNRNTPKLDSDDYSQGLKDLIAYALDSNPATRPTMADILTHPYIAETEEDYPTLSVAELVRNYYQWSQRGGQRVSLFHPGGAAAAELPGAEETDEDWSFSTTDGFERRFSVIDLDQIAASLAEMEEAISPTTPAPDSDLGDEFNEADLNPEDKANFDERVRRGAEAMEGLFNEDMPSYTYETKRDFVPIQPSPPPSDLPLRTETDRSSVTSTFIDIDIGSFDSSHYAAGTPAAQPFQLADADTIRANRSSIRIPRGSNDSSSQSSNSDIDINESQDEGFKPSGPRPPTMDWKFPSFSMAPPEDGEPEAEPAEAEGQKDEPAAEPTQEENFTDEKRATMEWTFPVMGSQPEAMPAIDEQVSTDTDRHDTVRAPVLGLQRQPTHSPAISRPSTSASNNSSMSDSDYDPFRFDRPTTPKASSQSTSFDPKFPSLVDNASDDDSTRALNDSVGILDGPGPDEEEEEEVQEESHQTWHEETDIISLDDLPLPTAIPVPDRPNDMPTEESEPGSPVIEEPLQTARRRNNISSFPTPLIIDSDAGISFPTLIPPNADSLMESADDATVTAELDRLLGDFLGALSATAKAFSRADDEPKGDGVAHHVADAVP